ncbi:MAG: Lrp/AsnC family transcriptional regulator [Gracilibacteraceae bacterium]|jgi:DNA-binding Lrp family transcriptional regulator|nr:Lrp/AsnC family transcriptional regulator [Gracilibacteraceae bacterium]
MTAAKLDAADGRLLNLIQAEIPITESPWAVLGEKAALTPAETLTRVAGLEARGLIRRLGGVFDSRRLGYTGTLCALQAPPERLRAIAAVVNAYAGVTHNYIRRHEYNMWFTLLAPGRAELGRLTKEISARAGAGKWLNLPARRYFKLRVSFPVDLPPGDPVAEISASEAPERTVWDEGGAEGGAANAPVFTAPEKRLIAALQAGLPLEPRPYAVLAAGLGWAEERALSVLTAWRKQGVLKRVAAIPRHRLIGYSANAMVVWRVPPAQVETVGQRLAARPEVTHCYERETMPQWPYNVYTMLHARDEEACRLMAGELAALIGIKEYELLFSETELKKSGMKYFS